MINVFIKQLQNLLECEQTLTKDSVLSSLEEWDSLSRVGFIAMANVAYGKKITSVDLTTAKTVEDLYNMVK